MRHREGLLIGSACESGEIFSAVADGYSRLEQRRLAEFYDYLEIQPICNNTFLLYGDRPKAKNLEDLMAFNRRIVELGSETGKPVVATCDAHFIDPEEEVFRRVLLASKEFEDADRELPLYFRTTEEMLEEFAYLGEETAYEVVVENTRRIADMCGTVRPLPPAKTLYAPKIDNSADDLKKLVYDRMRELYGECPPELIRARVETELGDILGRGYDVIYMSAQKLVADSLAHGYLVGSRGSVGSSLVAYLAGITEVNAAGAHRCEHAAAPSFESGRAAASRGKPDKSAGRAARAYMKEGFAIRSDFSGLRETRCPITDLKFSGNIKQRAQIPNDCSGQTILRAPGTIGSIVEKTAYGYVKKYLENGAGSSRAPEENRLRGGCVGGGRGGRATGPHRAGSRHPNRTWESRIFCQRSIRDDRDTASSRRISTTTAWRTTFSARRAPDTTPPTTDQDARRLTASTPAIPLDDRWRRWIFSSSPGPLGRARWRRDIGGTAPSESRSSCAWLYAADAETKNACRRPSTRLVRSA
jgi:DNA polymerase-3 subunit alpha (Gram-positive type)